MCWQVCLESFERFVRIQERCCPICRKKDYEKKEVTHGVMAWKNICATKAQAWLRGVLVRKKYKASVIHYASISLTSLCRASSNDFMLLVEGTPPQEENSMQTGYRG